MYKLFVVTFGLLGWTYYEMSGGADFEPEIRADAQEIIEEQNLSEETAVQLASVANQVVLPDTSQTDPEALTQALAEALDDAPAINAEATEVAALEASDAEEEAEPVAEMTVTANALNVRGGPSTSNGVVGRLTRGEIVEVMAQNDDGWSQIRIQGDGVEGWVATRFLGDS